MGDVVGPAVPRIRHHARRHHPDLGGGVADARADGLRQAAASRRREVRENAFQRKTREWFDRLIDGYAVLLRYVLDHQTATLLVALGTLALTAWLYIVIPKGFFPVQDTGLIQGISEAPQSISFAAMAERQQALADGHPQGSRRRQPVVLHRRRRHQHHAQQRPLPHQPQAARHAHRRRERDHPPPDPRDRIGLGHLAVHAAGAGPHHRRRGEPDAVSVRRWRTPIPTELAEWAPRLVDKLNSMPQFADVSSDISAYGLSAYIDIDRDTAGRFGITPATIDNALYDSFGQRIVSTIFTNSNQYRVILEADPKLQASLRFARPRSTSRPRPAPGQVPLSAVAHVREETAPLRIDHLGQFPSTSISFNLAPGASLGEAVDAHQAGEPGDRPAAQRHHQACRAPRSPSRNRCRNELLLILAAIVTVYIVLGVLYESFVHPVTILSTLPSAGIGALLALIAAGDDLTVIAIIGIILLIGIVKKNAIMMIDFALDAERNENKPPREAIYQACLLRFRPILMTTMAAVLGALPLMIGTGVGSELRHPLGISIVGGLAGQPGADAVHHAGDLSVVRPPADSATSTSARDGRRGRTGGRRNEPLDALHPAAGRDHPAHLRGRGGGRRRVLPASGVAAAAGRLSDHLGAGAASRRQPRGRRHQRRDAARAPSRPDRRRHRNDLGEHRRLDAHHTCSSASTATSTAPRATCRRRSMRRGPTCRPACGRTRPTRRSIRPTPRS